MKTYGQFDIRSILGDQAGQDHLEKAKATKVFLPEIGEIKPNPENIFSIDEEETARLAENIEENGILHDLVCYRDNDGYTLVSGHRRLTALQKLAEEGKSYSYHGMDITGKAPVTVIEKPDSLQKTTLQIISANHQRNMSAAEKQEVIRQTLSCLRELEEQGLYKWPKGVRTCTVLAEKTGIAEHFIKDYLAKAGISKNNSAQTDTVSPPSSEDDKQIKAVKELKKAIRTLGRRISTSDKSIPVDNETKEQILQLIENLQAYIN